MASAAAVTIHNFHEHFNDTLKNYNTKSRSLDADMLATINHFISNGTYYGYPPCCIYDWVFRVIIVTPKIQASPEQERASERSGFLPCPTHAKQVLEKTIKLKDLILATRQSPHEFLYARGAE